MNHEECCRECHGVSHGESCGECPGGKRGEFHAEFRAVSHGECCGVSFGGSCAANLVGSFGGYYGPSMLCVCVEGVLLEKRSWRSTVLCA